MAFSPRSLARIAQVTVGDTTGVAKAQPPNSLFLYGTDDAAAVVEAAGYFNTGRANNIRPGDLIMATMAVVSGTAVTKHYVFLTVPASGNVTVGLQQTTAG